MATYLDEQGKLRDENGQRVDDYGSVVEDMADEAWAIRETMEDSDERK